MSLRRYAAMTDSNQADIVAALRQAGCSVVYIKKPVDLAVGRAGMTFFLEVKRPKGKGQRAGEKTLEQVAFFESWRGHVAEVTTVEEAYAAVGLRKEGT